MTAGMMTVSTGQHWQVVRAPGVRWYAVNTLPHRELRTKYQLENQGNRLIGPFAEQLGTASTHHA